MNAIIVYYSYTGNTRLLADSIAKKLGCDKIEIKTAVSYPSDYNTTVQQGQDEVEAGFMPEINHIDISNYDTVILGTPVWWYTFAPAVKTFLETSNLNGKKIYGFITNGGWIGHTIKDISTSAPCATIGECINIKFSGSNIRTSEKEIDNWISKISE